MLDGYCDVCGMAESSSLAAVASPVSSLSQPLTESVPAAASDPTDEHDDGAGSNRSVRTSSTHIEATMLGSHRAHLVGSRSKRRVGEVSRRLRAPRLGAGLTAVPTAPVADPMASVMKEAVLPERRRFCAKCDEPVGRSRDGKPGRSEGFCPNCRHRFSFTPQLAPGDLINAQYEVVGCLAFGGLGWIYLGRDQNVSGRWVVLKGLLNSGDPDAYAAAIAERQFLAEVAHPLIVEIYNFVMHDGAGYIVMEYVGGPSLKQILKDRRDAAGGQADPLAVDQALAYILEVMPALQYLHDKGLLFCDFKPDNMIQVGDSVRLIDLGGVRRMADDDSAIYGTVGYQAPEVPEAGPSIASDIYTIGRTLASLVLDFRGNQTTYVDSLPPLEDTPVFATYDSFYRLIAKACALDPDDRFTSVDEMRTQMLGVLREVVMTDLGSGHPASTSAGSVLFGSPDPGTADAPLRWQGLPPLRVEDSDTAKDWLSSVKVADPIERLKVLATAPEATTEVKLAIVHAAIEAERWARVKQTISEILVTDPWEWRAVWMSGLSFLAQGEPEPARASFNAVYGQVPGELAPKLALAQACEASSEPGIAEQLYTICARCDADYTSPAAFGLARIREARSDLSGALQALDIISPSRASYSAARVRRIQLLLKRTPELNRLSYALESIRDIAMPERVRLELTAEVLRNALELLSAKPDASSDKPLSVRRILPAVGGGAALVEHESLGDIRLDERSLRFALELNYRERAALTDDAAERHKLVDEANNVRPWTWV